jgi:hypothetical protein
VDLHSPSTFHLGLSLSTTDSFHPFSSSRPFPRTFSSVICRSGTCWVFISWGTVLYTVRGVGSGSRDVDACRANGLYVEDRGLQVPMTLEHPVTSSGKAAPGTDPRIRHRIQIVMFRPIRVDHTNCLQVGTKTHSFIHFVRSEKVDQPTSRDPSSHLSEISCNHKPQVAFPQSVGSERPLTWIRTAY